MAKTCWTQACGTALLNATGRYRVCPRQFPKHKVPALAVEKTEGPLPRLALRAPQFDAILGSVSFLDHFFYGVTLRDCPDTISVPGVVFSAIQHGAESFPQGDN